MAVNIYFCEEKQKVGLFAYPLEGLRVSQVVRRPHSLGTTALHKLSDNFILLLIEVLSSNGKVIWRKFMQIWMFMFNTM